MHDGSDIYYIHELIDALDRRAPRPRCHDAEEVARAVAVLRRRAIWRLAELGGQPQSRSASSAD